MADINQPEKYVNMTDLNPPLARGAKTAEAKRGNGRPGDKGAPLPEAKLHEFAELLFFAYRDFTKDPDAILANFGFGRAHHRVLHFVNRHSGLRVADLLEILTITKQSLSRVLKQLIDQGYIVQQAGSSDRRQRLLFPTPRGRALAERLAAPQLVRLTNALQAAGPGAEATLRRFLEAMINAEDRPKVSSIMSASPVEPSDGGKGGGS
ncbi:MAG: MarR family winged helix-turn-helix transcriptional regulator [Methyloceanibacter sp.]|uniref:MarR family winged helix-turn-helix transcriptional regulator n=1 Tax=Methyloceanibacter sp. TaxID=1965321 RepID=UPI003D6D770B